MDTSHLLRLSSYRRYLMLVSRFTRCRADCSSLRTAALLFSLLFSLSFPACRQHGDSAFTLPHSAGLWICVWGLGIVTPSSWVFRNPPRIQSILCIKIAQYGLCQFSGGHGALRTPNYWVIFRLCRSPTEKHLSLKITLWAAFLRPEVTWAMLSVTGPFY